MRIYGNFFYNRLPKRLTAEEIFYSGLNLSEKTVVEAGTYIGIFTYLFAQTANRVIGFEPNPATFAMAKRNVEANGLENVALINAGLSDQSGKAEYVAERFMSARGTFKKDKHAAFRNNTRHIVQATASLLTADEALQGTRVDFVKIDTEGYEPMVLGGMSETLARYKPDIYFEVHGLDDNQKTADLRKILSLLPNYCTEMVIT